MACNRDDLGRRWAARALWTSAVCLALLHTTACSTSGESSARTVSALTEAEIARTLGCESLLDWSSPSGTLGLSDVRVQGEHSLSVLNNGWTEVVSRQLSSLGDVGTTLSYRVQVPSGVSWGETRVVVRIPSQQVWWQELGSRPLTGLSPGSFHTIQYDLPASLIAALESTYSDLEIRVVINAQVTGQPYLLDDLDLGQPDQGGTGGTGGAGGTAGQAGSSGQGGATGGAGSGGTSAGSGGTSSAGTSGSAGTGGSAVPFEEREVHFSLPPLLGFDRVAALASEDASLGDRSRVQGAPGTLPAVVAMAGTGMFVNTDALLANVYSRNQLELRDRTHVAGSIFTTMPVIGLGVATVDGSVVTDFAFDPTTPLRWTVRLPATSSGPVHLEPDTHEELAPGRYGTVSIKSRSSITLTAGDYVFDALEVLEPQAELVLDESAGPIRLYALNNLVFRGSIRNITNEGLPELLTVVFGSSPIFLETSFQSFLFAPNATVNLRETAMAHSGAIFAKRVVFEAGARLDHRPFRFDKFFPGSIALEPFGALPCERGAAAEVDSTPVPNANVGHEACDPGLKLTYELDGIQPKTTIETRTLAESTKGCVVEYRECTEDGQDLGAPTGAELNAIPSADSICEGDPEVAPCCGIDESTIVWDDEFGLCESNADCLLFGKVCARICLEEGCTGSSDCLDPTCPVEERRCASPNLSCPAIPTEGQCEERRECPDPLASGSSDPTQHQLTGRPASNVNDPPAATPPSTVEPDTRPETYAQAAACTLLPGLETGVSLVPEPDVRDVVAGNDKWGIYANADIDFNAFVRPHELGGQATLDVGGHAGGKVGVRVWGHDVDVFTARADATLTTCGGSITRELKLFGFVIDPGGDGEDGLPQTPQDNCDDILSSRSQRAPDLRDAMFRAIEAKKFAECLGPFSVQNEALYRQFCEESLGSLEQLKVPGYTPPLSCASQAQVEDIPGEWIKLYKANRDLVAGDIASVLAAQQALIEQLPPSSLPFLDLHESFTAFHVEFEFPVGPVSVIIEIELGGSYGVSGVLETEFSPNPIVAKVQGRLQPGLDVTAIAFAGVGLGPVSVGIGGELVLMDLQTPVTSGVTVRQTPESDPRPAFAEGDPLADLPYAFASQIPNVPGFVPFGPTWSKWTADWTYGAGARAEFLNGSINLQARVNLLFFKKTFKKTIASWQGIPFAWAFTGSFGGTDEVGRTTIEPARGDVDAGWFYEHVFLVDPDALASAQLTAGPGSGDCTEPPEFIPCVVVP